jgi:hypothetical protein
MPGTSAKQLFEAHTDNDWRLRFSDLVDLMDLLRDCLIKDSYSVPDSMNAAIALSEPGAELKSRLIRKENVGAKEAHLMCALTLGHDSLFLDVEHADIDQLVKSISLQIQQDEIRFPLLYGRALYDAFAEAFQDEKDHLSNEETMRLLDSIPRGVFSMGVSWWARPEFQ